MKNKQFCHKLGLMRFQFSKQIEIRDFKMTTTILENLDTCIRNMKVLTKEAVSVICNAKEVD